MAVFARVLRLLSMVVWVGGLVFFAFVLAPTAFRVLPSTHLAGSVVGAPLHILPPVGEFCAAFFLIGTIVLLRSSPLRTRRLLGVEGALVILMVAATFYVQARIVPAMERDRIAAGGDVDAAPPDNPARLDFERLHPISEKVEGAALFLGLGVVVLMAFESDSPDPNAAANAETA
jgi:uncharacterized membrane protein